MLNRTIRTKTAAFIAAVLFSTAAHSAGYYNNFTIAELEIPVGADGLILVYTGGTGNANPDGCPGTGRFVISYTDTPDNAKTLQAGAMMAFALKKNVKAYLTGCITGLGNVDYPQVKVLHVVD